MKYYTTHTIAKPETLQDIAAQKLGDVTRWVELKDLNDLVYPYIVGTDAEKEANPEHLMTWGDVLKLPTINPINAYDLNYYADRRAEEGYDASFGMDMAVDFLPNGSSDNFAYLPGQQHPWSDIGVVKGIANLKQSLELRLMTRKGSNLYHPNYGSYLLDMIGEKLNEDLVARIRIEIVRTVKTDRRVDTAAVNKWLVPDGKSFYGEIEVQPRDRDVQFQIFISLANSGQITFG